MISVIEEFLHSERKFVRDMEQIFKTYIHPLMELQILSSSEIDALFLNWSSLTRLHEKFADALIERANNDENPIPIGEIFLQYSPDLFSEYEIFFRFHSIAMKCFREKLRSSSKFRSFMDSTKRQSSGFGTFGDANILTLPLQRIAKYPFLIDQILKNTPNESSDREHLENALKKTSELRSTINNVIEEEINRMKFDWLEKHLDLTKFDEQITFNSLTHFAEQRKLIHYSHIRSSRANGPLFYAMLFNDFLLLTRPKQGLFLKVFEIFHRHVEHVDWFENEHLSLILHKKPLMLHDIRKVRSMESDSNGFQLDYRGREMHFFASSANERVLWTKHLNDAIDHCRRERCLTAMFRAPDMNGYLSGDRPLAKLFIQMIRAENLPRISPSKRGPNAYCIMEMNHGQRQTTPILWDKSHLQWTIFFRFDIFNMNEDRLKCSIYHRVKYSTDRLLGSIELPIGSLIDRPTIPEDFSSIYSLKSERSTRSHSLQRSFDMLPSSNPCHLLLEYVYQLGD